MEFLDDELRDWEELYSGRLEEKLTPVMEARVRQRMQGIDFVRHSVYETVRKLIEIV